MILLPCCLRMLLLVCGGLACIAIMSTDDESQLDQLKPGIQPMPFFTLKWYLLRLQKQARRREVRRRSRLIRVLLLDMTRKMQADKKKNA